MKIMKTAVSIVFAVGAMLCAPVQAETHRFVLNIGTAPPPARVEVVPAPRRGWVWAPGHWGWRAHRHVWVRGHWVRARHGHHWAAAHWVERDGRWWFERGHWVRGG